MKLVLVTLLLMRSMSFAGPAVQEKFYENSSATPLLTLLKNAKTSVDIEIYEMDDPLFLTAVKDAVDRGVRVRVVKEDRPVGASCRVFSPKSARDDQSCQTQKDLVSYVRKSGGQYVAFNHPNLCATSPSCFEHGKIAVVDNLQALISTGNFNSSNLCNKKEHPTACNRDYSVVSKDASLVTTLTQVFENDLKGDSFDISALMAKAVTQKLTVSPLSLKPLVEFIASAKLKVQVQNQYLKDPELNQALIAAAKRGVIVEVMVASDCSFGKPSASEAKKWTAIYETFDQAGVHSRVFTRNIKINGVAGYLHAKAIVVDGLSAWVGSVNGSTMSLSNNREYGVFLGDANEVKKLQTFMDQDFADPMGETWQDSVVCKHDPVPSPQGDSQIHSPE